MNLRENTELSQLQKDVIDERLEFIKNNPGQLISVEDFIKELDLKQLE